MIDFLYESCFMGMYYFLGKIFYGDAFIDQEKKQPLHRKVLLTIAALILGAALGTAILWLAMSVFNWIKR